MANAEGVKTLFGLEQAGAEKLRTFVDERILSSSCSVHAPIKKSNVHIFAGKKKPLHPENKALLGYKANNQLFWRLYASSVARKLDISTFFEYENQALPPALTEHGKLKHGQKAELVKILEELVPGNTRPATCNGIVYDGGSLVHNDAPRTKSFQEYVEDQLLAHAQVLVDRLKAERVDFVWDLYLPQSIKSTERESRGAGIRKKDLPEKGNHKASQ